MLSLEVDMKFKRSRKKRKQPEELQRRRLDRGSVEYRRRSLIIFKLHRLFCLRESLPFFFSFSSSTSDLLRPALLRVEFVWKASDELLTPICVCSTAAILPLLLRSIPRLVSFRMLRPLQAVKADKAGRKRGEIEKGEGK